MIDKWAAWSAQYRWSGSHSQLSDSTEHGSVEFFQLSPVQSPVQGLTHFTAGPPKIDVVLIVGHRVLDGVSRKPNRVGGDVPESS